MKKRLLSLLLLAAMVIGMVCPAAAAEGSKEEDTAKSKAIVYIPLDDRPLNDHRVKQLAESLDLTLVMPDQDLYTTRLDGQPKNANGTQSGDRGALLAWLMEQADQYDTFIISLDQLLSGGLMNSRCMTEMEPIVLPNGTTMTEYNVIDYIASLSRTKHVYVIDSILRLAMSSGYGGYGLRAYYLTRSYGMKARPVLSGWQLTLQNVIQNYPNCIDAQGVTAESGAVDAETEVLNALGMEGALEAERRNASVEQLDDDTIIEQYLQIRERKLRLVDYAVRRLAKKSNVEYLLGVDDSSNGNNIHTNEIAYIERIGGKNVTMLSALDGIAPMILCKYYGEQTETLNTTLAVKYFGIESDWVPAYNYMTVSELLKTTADYMEAEITDEESGDISLLLVTSSSDHEKNKTVFMQLIEQINQNEQNGIPTMILDFTEEDRELLHQMLIQSVHLGSLLSYSGGSDDVIQVPMCLSYGIARYRSLSQNVSDKAIAAQAETIVTALVLEYYKNDGVSEQTIRQLDSMGVNCNNFGTDDQASLDSYGQILDANMKQNVGVLLDNIKASNLIVGLAPFTTAAISNISIPEYSFPWNRTFEIDFDVSCTIAEDAYPYQYHAGYIQGMGDGTFAPQAGLTRNQAAKMLIAVSETALTDSEACPFADVSNWAKPYVATAYEKGYMRGYTDGSFRGDNNMTRAEFVSMLAQYLKAEHIKLKRVADVTFSDVSKSQKIWYTDNVYLLADAGVVNGYMDGSFRPEELVTRTEAVVMLGRLFDRTDSAPDWAMESSIYGDVLTSFWGYQAIVEASIGHFAS